MEERMKNVVRAGDRESREQSVIRQTHTLMFYSLVISYLLN